MQAVDTVIEARWVVPVQPRTIVLEHHCVVLEGGRIKAVLPSARARQEFAPSRRVTLERHALIPGLVNVHAHSAMALLRGAGDDLPLARWLNERIWPLERALVAPDFVYDGTRLAALEMVRGGITCCNDMYFFPGEAAQALRSLGMRAVVGIMTIDFPSRYATDADDYLRQGLATRDALRTDPLVGFTLAPHAPYTVSDESLRRIVALAEELDLPIHMHVHETAQEVADSMRLHGMRPLERLDKLGLVSERLIAVHATQLSDQEIERLAQRGCAVAHCPASNLKLASGIAPVARLLAAGVGVGIGTDGAASNNRLDMLGETALAALLAKGSALDATALPSWQALECATLGGARALGLDQRIGSIEVGKDADLCAIDLGAVENQPCYDPISQIVYSAGRENVTHVWVLGNEILVDRQPSIDGKPLIAEEILQAAAPWQNLVRQKLRQNPITIQATKKGAGSA
jgi:5-methylthioadenosine/S-adenosylhomocysteine deaminase